MRLKLKQLKDLIRESLLSSDELDTNFVQDGHVYVPLKQAMEAWDLKIIESSKDKNGRLGAGAYGVVFEVLWQGRQCALKITSDDDDAEAYEKVMNIKTSLPEVPKSVLPTVYKQGQFGDYFTVTLMEYLAPVPSSLKVMLTSYSNHPDLGITNKQLARFSKQFVDNVDSYLDDIVGSDFAWIKKASDKLSWVDVKVKLRVGYVWPDKMIRDVPDNFVSSLMFFQEFFEQFFPWTYANKYAKQLSNKFVDETKDSLKLTQLPIDGNGRQKMPEFQDKRLKKLVLGLRWLSQKGYLEGGWTDVHSSNVMVRPKTGDLVVADVGLFYFA